MREIRDRSIQLINNKELTIILLKGCGIIGLIAYVFFNNIFLSICFTPYVIYYVKKQKIIINNKNKERLKIQFFEVLEIVSAYIKTGMSIEKAFDQVVTDVEMLYGINSSIYNEINNINISVEIDIRIEDAIKKLAKKMDIKEISNFAELFEISIKQDGNVVNVIESICSYVKGQIELNRQVRLSINSVLQEISIMKVMPIGILIYLRIFSKDYIEGIYSSGMGLFIMFIILIVYGITLYIIDRMKQKILIIGE
ncbi:MAG: hypothetical protein E7262_03640 [Lachnospiraceae bacterium]|nr:hypothetical protein [Lachnospiraceae bacterium]